MYYRMRGPSSKVPTVCDRLKNSTAIFDSFFRDWIFRGTVIASNSTRFYGVEKFPKPETLADSRGILGDLREFDESNGTCPLPAFNDSNLIDSRNMTIRCYISIMGLCITVFWYKCVILWDICFIISLLKS